MNETCCGGVLTSLSALVPLQTLCITCVRLFAWVPEDSTRKCKLHSTSDQADRTMPEYYVPIVAFLLSECYLRCLAIGCSVFPGRSCALPLQYWPVVCTRCLGVHLEGGRVVFPASVAIDVGHNTSACATSQLPLLPCSAQGSNTPTK